MPNTLVPLVVVEVSGGVVQQVYTDLPANVILVDWDNIEAGDGPGVYPHEPLSSMAENTDAEVQKVLPEPPRLACSGHEANRLFDQITGASYYGTHFREVLMSDGEAYMAAQMLEKALLRAGVRGMDSQKVEVRG